MKYANNKKVRHSKFKNTGLIFEFLLRQITVDVLNKDDNSSALNIIKSTISTLEPIKILLIDHIPVAIQKNKYENLFL